MTSNRTIILVVALLFAPVCFGQTTSQGALTGVVSDPSGAVVPGIAITVTDIATGIPHRLKTTSDGIYRISFLPPGSYLVVAEASGFKKQAISGVAITVGQTVNLDIRMEVGTPAQTVTVSAPAAQINAENASRSEVITQSAIDNLPLNGREWIQLAELVPGAINTGGVKDGMFDAKGNVDVSFNGARDTYNSFLVDGADSTDSYHNTLISSPPLDAVREFRVQTNMYSAQFGRSGGASIMAVTNSGTNAFHGTLYEYLRNKAVDALPAFANEPRNQFPMYLWNQYGGSVGGPIKKDKIFFFYAMEKLREKTPGALMVGFAPTAAEAQGNVNGTINPWTGDPTVLTDLYTGAVIPSGQLPASEISSSGKALMGVWSQYTPNYNDPFLNLHLFRGSQDAQNKYLPRIDYNINEKNSLNGMLDWDSYDNGSAYFTPYGDELNTQHDRTMSYNFTHIFTPAFMNNLGISYTWYFAGAKFKLPNPSASWDLYAPLNQTTPRVLMYTAGYSTFQIGNDGPLSHQQHTLYLHDNFTWVVGKHNLTFGGDFRQEHFNWSYDSGNTEDYFGLLDGYPGVQDYYWETGSTFTDLLTGDPMLNYIGAGGGRTMPFSRNAISGFFQDDWKVAPRLFLSLGVRYDYEAPFSIDNGEMVTLDFKTGLPQYCAKAPQSLLQIMQIKYETGGPCRDHNPDYHDFAPRVGLAFRPFNNDKTVVRGGYGIFYTSENAFNTTYQGWVQPFAGVFPWYAGSAEWSPTLAPGNSLYDGNEHLTNLSQEPYGLSSVQGLNLGYFLPSTPYYPTAYVQQYNLSVDKDIGWRSIASLAWVGSRGVNLNGPVTLAYYSQSLANEVESLNPSLSTSGLRTKGFNSYFNSLQASVRKETSHGLWFLANYSWGHALTDMSNDNTNETLYFNTVANGSIATRRLANADFDIQQHMSFAGTWMLPFGHGEAFGGHWSPAVNQALGGWQVSAIVSAQTGLPFTVYTSSLNFPDRVCGGNLSGSQRSLTNWFNYSCFANHTGTTITNPITDKPELIDTQGNSPANAIFGPGFQNWDLAAQKGFKIHERVGLRFQAQFFNAFNHIEPQAPPGNYFFNTASGTSITRAGSMRDIQFSLSMRF